MKKLKIMIRAVLAAAVLLCVVFGASGCTTAKKLPEGDKVAIGFHRMVEGDVGDNNIYVACIVNQERILDKSGKYFLIELFYGYEGNPQSAPKKDFKISVEVDSNEIKQLSGEEFFTEKYICTAMDEGSETEQAWRRYEYQFNHSEIIKVPYDSLRPRDRFEIWVTAKSDVEYYTSYPLIVKYVVRSGYTGFAGETVE